MLDKIKIGRKEYQIQKGDYILFNGSCYMFNAGDGRTLKWGKWVRYTYLVIPKTVLKTIPFDDMKKVEKFDDKQLTYWFF